MVSGVVGWVLLLGWTLTDHEVMLGNLSLLAFSPASLLLLPILVRSAWRRTPLGPIGTGLLVLPGAFGAIVAVTGDYDLGFYVAAAPTLITGIILLRRTIRTEESPA